MTSPKDDKVHGDLSCRLDAHSHRLEEWGKLQSEILQVVTRIDTRCETCQQSLHEHEQAINGLPGNGANPGLKTRIATSEERIETVRSDMDKIERKYTWVIRSLIGVAITFVSGLLLWGIQILVVAPDSVK